MENPLSMEETLEGLNDIYKEKHGVELPNGLIAAIERMTSLAENNIDAAKNLETFCKTMQQKNLVRIVCCEVPDKILPVGYKATLSDVKVNSRGPDDIIYKKNPDMRRMIARGTTTMQLTGPESWFDVVVYANKKFTGGVGDEDENQPENDEIWREYCLEPPENAEDIVCMEKLNGEAAHFSGRYISGKFYIIAGSKNTHMLIQGKEDIELYQGDRFTVARVVAKAVCAAIEELPYRVRHLLYSFLHHTKTTAICEILQPQYQHIVDLSYLEKNLLNLIAFTPTANGDRESTLTALPPHNGLDLGKALGFSVAPYSMIKLASMMEQRDKVRAETHKEGEVLYYLNKSGETFGIAKAKSVWYIFLRSLREKVVYAFTTAKKKPGWNLEKRIESAFTRFTEIQSWLKVSDTYVGSWKKLAKSFFIWLDKEIKENRLQGGAIRPRFPIVWNKFLLETNQDDRIQL